MAQLCHRFTPLVVMLAVLLPFQSAYGKENDFVKTVHIVFMNHLDVGFADLVNNILNEYFQKYFPQAATLGKILSDGGYAESFIYTTHPWLVSMYLDCPPNFNLSGVHLKCPNATQVSDFRNAVSKGYITWHAGPMNLQPENSAEWLFQFSLQLGIDLDKRFGINRTARVLSQRDVPGMTQAVIPSLLKMGVSGVSVGVNNMTPPPAVPVLFRWQYNGQDILATYHKGGYPDNPGPDPKHPGGISRDQCATFPGFPHALCFAFRSDNSGPPQSLHELLGYYEILRVEFPDAQLKASTLEGFFEELEAIRDKLPVITQEISDTWIQGIQSDPRKIAEFRAMTRVMGKCLQTGKCSLDDPRVYNSSRLLVKLSEHTYGVSTVGDTVNWTNTELEKAKHLPNYMRCVNSWQEQRNFTYIAVDALKDHSIVQNIQQEMNQIQPKMPDLSEYTPLLPSQWSKIFQCSNEIQFGFNGDGSIGTLNYKSIKWASATNPLAQFMYQTFNQTDFDNFGKIYNFKNGISAGYYKNNVTMNAHPESHVWPSIMQALYIRNSGVPVCDFYAQLKLLDSRAYRKYGAPRDVWIHYMVNTDPKQPGIDVTLQLFDKTSTRLPETLMFVFKPIPQNNGKWQISKLGHVVDPLNVILNGSQMQHGLDENGATYSSNGTKIQISSPDVAVACPIPSSGLPHTFPAPLKPWTEQPSGIAFNLYNNIWDVNWIFWYPYSAVDTGLKYRFNIKL